MNFSKDFCNKNDIPFYSETIDIAKNLDKSLGFEATARKVRYDFFDRSTTFFGANKIATAHNADDNLETILLNISRGTGLKGLLGIPSCRENIIRPILKLSRSAIENYLETYKIDFITDSSNHSDDYSRNKIRHHCLPVLKNINSSAISNTTKMCTNLKNDYDFIEKFSDMTYNSIVTQNGCDFCIEISEVLKMHKSISFRVINKILMDFDLILTDDKFNKILSLCCSNNPSSRLDVYNNLSITRNYQNIIFAKYQKAETILNLSAYDDVITIYTNKFHNLYKEYSVSYDIIDFDTLFVRNRQVGDRFYFKNHSKSLKNLFIDNKIPKDVRDDIPILCDKDGVICVLNFGISYNRFKKDNKKIIFRSI